MTNQKNKMPYTNQNNSRTSWLAAGAALGLVGGLTASAQDFLPLGVSTNHHSYYAEHSYSAESKISQGHRDLGDISTYYESYSYVYSTHTGDDLGWATGWRVGAAVQHFAFDVPNRTPLPERLGAMALRLGVNQRLSERWSMSLEAQPGIYSDFEDISGDDFNVPFGLGAMFNQTRDLQWVFGLSVNARREYPVLPGVGLRWRFADQWCLMLGVPRTRLEFAPDDRLALFTGVDVSGGTFAVAKDFGNSSGRRDLNGEIVEYREIRVGAGARYKFTDYISASAEVGWMTDRRFEFHDRDLLLNGDGAPYVQFSIGGSF